VIIVVGHVIALCACIPPIRLGPFGRD